MASEMPVLPLVGSRMVQPGVSRPSFSACSTIQSAGRYLMEPVGLRSSSLAQTRTSAEGERRGSPTIGVRPTESVSDSNRMSPAGYGREHGDRVAVGDLGAEPAEEAHVLVVQVDVDEAAQAVVVDEAVLDAGVAGLQVGDQLVQGGAFGADGLGAVGVVTQDGRNANLDGHRCLSPRSGRRPHRHATPTGVWQFLLRP